MKLRFTLRATENITHLADYIRVHGTVPGRSSHFTGRQV
jgi:hypothetical protein